MCTSELLNFICIYFHEFLKYGNDFWCKRKLNIHTLRWKSFLPPSLVFPPFFYIGDSLKIESEHANYQYSKQKRGVKNQQRGVKNFCIFWSNISAFICTKNHCHILKTHENIYSGVICSNHSKSGKKSSSFKSLN